MVIFALDARDHSLLYSYVANAVMGTLFCEPFPLLACHFLYRYFAIAKFDLLSPLINTLLFQSRSGWQSSISIYFNSS